MNKIIEQDKKRYQISAGGRMPLFQRFYRRVQSSSNPISKVFWKSLFFLGREQRHIDMSSACVIGPGLYLGHAYCITINAGSVIGKNCNIHKCVTIGQENRGPRKGTPVIGDCVWIGSNAIVVGNIKIGNDVLIAPGAYVNFDIPDHSVVLGNPGKVYPKEDATESYINNKV